MDTARPYVLTFYFYWHSKNQYVQCRKSTKMTRTHSDLLSTIQGTYIRKVFIEIIYNSFYNKTFRRMLTLGTMFIVESVFLIHSILVKMSLCLTSVLWQVLREIPHGNNKCQGLKLQLTSSPSHIPCHLPMWGYWSITELVHC